MAIIFCVRRQTIPADANLYEYMIKPMSNATEQQIIYAEIKANCRQNSDATAEALLKCTNKLS